jgi:hypothetical protein
MELHSPVARLRHRPTAGDRGAAVLLLTTILAMVALAVGTAYFMQSRAHRHELMRKRAKMHARYCAEYAVARHGIPAFMLNNELIDTGNDFDNFIEPRRRTEIFSNIFQAEDMGHRFSYGFDSLKMDKIFDLNSSKPFFFVSAQGVVTWRDGKGNDHEVRHRSAVALTFNDFSRYMYFSNGELGPENNEVHFGAGENWYGRIHINGRAVMSPFGLPVFHGFFTQTEDQPANISPDQYDAVFQGGHAFPYARVAWPPVDAINQIKEQRTADHTYEASIIDGDGIVHPVTTVIRFDERRYRVAQYWADGLDENGDTIYVPQAGGQNWATKNLPTALGRELIWVRGVCRLQGRVMGKITVLTSDTLYLTGDIITADAMLTPCGDQQRFGVVPAGSPNRIGLASEGNIVIASTLSNGFANGADQPALTCGFVNEPVLSTCNQGRRDIVITAALFSVDCSFETEFWNTTAWGATLPPVLNHTEQCSGQANTHIKIWDNTAANDGWFGHVRNLHCVGGGAPQFNDARGRIWICGSIVQTHRGFVIRNAPGPWGTATIGYNEKVYRYDDNFLAGGPPVWFRVKYADGSQDVATEMLVPDYDRWREARRDRFIE